MALETIRLRTGDQLVVKMVHPPLLEYAGKVGCWVDIRDKLFDGQLAPWLFTPYFVGEIEGETIGSMSYCAPADTRDVGVVEFVETAEEHRHKGVSSALLGQLIKRFRADGGLALYLCTSNPLAGMLYEKHGFGYNVGDGMRWLSSDAQDFDRTYLAFSGTARVRDANWGDLPRAAVLYNHSEPQWFVKDYLTQSFCHTRFESHFVRLMKLTEGQRGAFLVLENPKGRVVGAAALARFDTFYEQHVATLSFRVCPSYFDQASELLEAAVRRANELSIKILQVFIADRDDEQKELVKEVGFSEEARLRNRLRNGDTWMDLAVYTLSRPGAVRPLRSAGDYYGGRQPWHEERISSYENQRVAP